MGLEVVDQSLHRGHCRVVPFRDVDTGGRIDRFDQPEEIQRIEFEGTIVLWGSLTLSEAFFAAGEVDAVRLVVMPIAIGAGRGVFPARQDPTLLSLRSAKTYDAGLVELDYAVRAVRSGG